MLMYFGKHFFNVKQQMLSLIRINLQDLQSKSTFVLIPTPNVNFPGCGVQFGPRILWLSLHAAVLSAVFFTETNLSKAFREWDPR